MWALSAVGYRRLGAAGSLAVVIGGWFAGKLPVHDPWGLWVDHGSAAKAVGAVIAYIGLTVLVVAWWQYGRTAATVRDTLVTLAWWTAPFLLAPPLYSADVYSYIAQARWSSRATTSTPWAPPPWTPAGSAVTPPRAWAITGATPRPPTAPSSCCSPPPSPRPPAERSSPPSSACGSSPSPPSS